MAETFRALGLSIALLAVAATALRVASNLGCGGMLRNLAAVPVGAAIVLLETLGLGLVGAGSNGPALVAAAVAGWLLSRGFVPRPDPGLWTGTAAWWNGLGGRGRACAGALAGVVTVWSAWMLRHPVIGGDGITHHLPQIAHWVHHGNPGAAVAVNPVVPFTAYPLTNEVLLSWLVAIPRSFVAVPLWSVLLTVIAGVAAWSALRGCDVGAAVSGLVVAVLLASPLVLVQLNTPVTDLPALSWLLCAAALAVGARRCPGAIAPALLSAGLAVGTKTTALPLAVALCAALAVACRTELRAQAGPVFLAAAAVVVVGGTWYLRDLWSYGSPVWPTASSPWGDPVPPIMRRLNVSFIGRSRATLHGRIADYRRALSGDLVLLVAAPLALIGRRDRLAAWLGGLTVVGALLWAAAPTTGVSSDAYLAFAVVGAVRYLLPTVAVAAGAVAMASRGGGARSHAAVAVLGGAAAWNVGQDLAFGFPFRPSVLMLGAAAVAGGVAGFAFRSVPTGRGGGAPVPQAVAALAGAVLLSLPFLVATTGFVERHAGTRQPGSDLVRWFVHRRGFATGRWPIAMMPVVVAPLAGDHLQHDLESVPLTGLCAGLRARLARGWVVVGPPLGREGSDITRRALNCLTGRPAAYRGGGFSVFAPTAV